MSIGLENTNDSGVSIDGLDFSIAIAEVPVASGVLKMAPLTLPARGSGRADIVATTDFAAWSPPEEDVQASTCYLRDLARTLRIEIGPYDGQGCT